MHHLNEVGLSYLQHLVRSLRWASILVIHGIFPNVWPTKVSGEMCKDKDQNSRHRSRAYMLKHMYGIDETDSKDIKSKNIKDLTMVNYSDK